MSKYSIYYYEPITAHEDSTQLEQMLKEMEKRIKRLELIADTLGYDKFMKDNS